MELFNAKDFMNSDGESASPEAAARIANNGIKEKHKAILDYCRPHMDHMWAAVIVGEILGCDFRDAKFRLEGVTMAEFKSAINFLRSEG